MKYAVNLSDLTAYASDMPVMLLLKPVLGEQYIICEPDQRDGIALPVRDDLQEGRFEAIHKFIRKRLRSHELRIYRSKTGSGGWERI